MTPFIKLGASWAGFNFRIKDIKKSGTPKRGYKYYIVCGGGNIANYWIDIEEAIPTGEVYVPNEFKPKPQTNSTGLADELLKLKKLLDDSLLTKEEFDIQKKKLLDQ
ncbi:MAG: hypothetical protein IPN36_13160 [Bacteroidetes bacterium]|nr:hypothetical protein [Bacteroidota bacterium]